jgi:GTP-binding protein
MIGTILEANPFLGRIITGRIVRLAEAEPGGQGSASRRHAAGKRPYLQDPRLPRARAPADRRGAGGRHRRHRRPVEGHRRRHLLRPVVTEPLTAQPIDPPTVTMSFLVNDSARWPAPKATR